MSFIHISFYRKDNIALCMYPQRICLNGSHYIFETCKMRSTFNVKVKRNR